MIHRGGRLAGVIAAPTVALLVVACAASDRTVVIGLAYRALADDPARLATIDLDSQTRNDPVHIRLLTSLPGSTGPANQLANEVDYARRLAAVPDLIAVVGHQGSREALLVAPIYDEAAVPVVIPTGTSRRLRATGRWSFTLAPNDSIEGAYIGERAAALGARAALLFYVGDEYGVGLRDGIASALAERQIRLIDAVPVAPSGNCSPVETRNAYAGVVDATLRRGRPDIVLLAARQREAGCIMHRLHRHFPTMRYIAGDGLLVNADFLSRAGASAESLYVVGFWHPDRGDSVGRAFAERFERLTGRQANSGDAMVYDAIMVLAHAVQVVGPSRERVRDYLDTLGDSRPAYQGVTGAVAFPGGPERLLTMRVRGGRLVPEP